MGRLAWVLTALAGMAFAGPSGERPRFNATYVPDDDGPTNQIVAAVRQAAEAGQAAVAAERLQTLLLSDREAVVPIRGRELFTSPRRWATLALLGGIPSIGPEVLAAWRAARDLEATTAIRGAIVAGDEAAILDLVDRFPASTMAPRALLLLSDRALLRGDLDAARGYLDRVAEHLAPAEATLLDDPAVAERRRILESLRRPPPRGWPTAGGDSARSRAGDPLAPGMTFLWEAPLFPGPLQGFEMARRKRPVLQSPTLPFHAVCDGERIYVDVGEAVVVVRRLDGRLLGTLPEGSEVSLDRAEAIFQESPGNREATVQEGVVYFARLGSNYFAGIDAGNTLVAWDVSAHRALWEISELPSGARLFFRGAPAVHGDRLFAYAAVREKGESTPTRKEEAWLLCIGRESGDILWSRFLGYGETDAPADFPPQSGLPPAVARGVVVAVSGLGVAAACDARTGEVLWTLRYDRKRPRERDRLNDMPERWIPAVSAWFREPPRIFGDRAYFAPFDSDTLYACYLRGRRRPGGEFHLVLWDKDRAEGHRTCLLEYFPGLSGDRAWCVGRRDERSVGYETVVSFLREDGTRLAYGRLPALDRDPETGRPLVPDLFGAPTFAGGELLVPTETTLYRFATAAGPVERMEQEIRREVPSVEPLQGEFGFGNLVAVDGFLYAVTADRVVAYGPPPR